MANPVRTTENSGGEQEGYTVVNDEDPGEVRYQVDPEGNGKADVTRYEPGAGGVEDADESDELPQKVPPEVANEIVGLGFTQITVGDTVMATEDPANPAVGDRWYRVDLGVMRRQTPAGVVESRDFYRPGEDYEYAEFGIGTVDVLEESFENTDPLTDADWNAESGGEALPETVISVVTSEASDGDKSVELLGSGSQQPFVSYTNVELDTGDVVTVKFDAFDAAEVGVKGEKSTELGTQEVNLIVNTATEEVSVGGIATPESIDLGSIPSGWVSYTVEFDGNDVTVTVEDTNTTDTATVGEAVPVSEIMFARAGTGTSYVDNISVTAGDLPDGTRLSPQITTEDIADSVDLGGGTPDEDSVTTTELETQDGPSGQEIFADPSLSIFMERMGAETVQLQPQRGDPDPNTFNGSGVYVSDGSGFGAAGDLIYAINDGGTIKVTKLSEFANLTSL